MRRRIRRGEKDENYKEDHEEDETLETMILWTLEHKKKNVSIHNSQEDQD